MTEAYRVACDIVAKWKEDNDSSRGLDPLREAIAEALLVRASLSAERGSQTVVELIYPCGCSAVGSRSLPRYCPDHPSLTAEQLNAAALLCERWGFLSFQHSDRVLVSLPTGADWITMTPELLEGLVSKLRSAAVLHGGAAPKGTP
jgi:hypothetical protein